MFSNSLIVRVSALPPASCVWLLLLIFPSGVWGHADGDLIPQTKVDGTMIVNYRSDAFTNEGQPWYISGAMMGGEAVPANQGFVVDDIFITFSHVDKDNVYGMVKMASHQGGGVAFEHAWLGYRLFSGNGSYFNIEAGRMAAAFSPANLAHADSRLTSDAALVFESFLGRQYHDDGVRFLWGNNRGLALGGEVWQGEAFPATPGEQGGAMDVFVQYKISTDVISWSVGAWYMRAKADSRSDDRYTGGHSHGVVVDTSPTYWFDGDTTLSGIHLGGQWRLSADFSAGLEMHWLWQEVEGDLRDDTRETELMGEANGGWLEVSAAYQQHTLGLRYERLVLNNSFSGVAGEALAALSHLNNEGHNPVRNTLVYRYQVQPSLTLRMEWQSDKSAPQREERWLLGLIWKKNIWTRNY